MKRITKIDAAAPQERKLRVAAYARVSTSSSEQLVSLEAQKNHYEKYIKSRPDWVFVGVYYDEGISGTKMDRREGLIQMLADCEDGLIDYIIVKSISRFSRNTVDSIEVVRNLCEKGIYVYFEKENIDTGKMESELLLSILSSLAESESRSISENLAWSVQKRFKQGTYKISYPPYGYRNDNGKMVIVEEEAEVVRRIFREYLDGVPSSEIAKRLNDENISTKKNTRWNDSNIALMIKNEKYCGDVLFQKTYTDSNFTRRKNNGERTQYLMKNHHEPIVSRETQEAAIRILEINAAEKGNVSGTDKYTNRYALSGKIKCACCGNTWKRITLKRGASYACYTREPKAGRCHVKPIKEESIKAAFVTMMNKLVFARAEVLVPYRSMLVSIKDKDVSERIEAIEEIIEWNKSRQQQILEFFTKSLIEPSVYATEEAMLKKEVEVLETEKDGLIRNIVGNQNVLKESEKLLEFTSSSKSFEEFDEEAFESFVDHIVAFSRTEIGFVMKCGPTFRERIDEQ